MRDVRTFWLVLWVVGVGCGNLQPTAAPTVKSRPTAPVSDPDTRAIQVYWVGHATALVRLGDTWILTDPNFASRLGLFVKRRVAPGIAIEDLPPVDLVVISHAHMDHLVPSSLKRLKPGGILIVPPGVRPYLPSSLPFDEIAILNRWQAIERRGVRITAVPARHANGRYYVDTLWNRDAHTGFVFEHGPLTMYFAGDTGYHKTLFKQIGERFDIDVALVPVGPADRPGWVYWLRKHAHASPSDALDILADIDAQWMVPIHYATFFKDGRKELSEIRRVVSRHALGNRVRIVPIGGATTFVY